MIVHVRYPNEFLEDVRLREDSRLHNLKDVVQRKLRTPHFEITVKNAPNLKDALNLCSIVLADPSTVFDVSYIRDFQFYQFIVKGRKFRIGMRKFKPRAEFKDALKMWFDFGTQDFPLNYLSEEEIEVECPGPVEQLVSLKLNETDVRDPKFPLDATVGDLDRYVRRVYAQKVTFARNGEPVWSTHDEPLRELPRTIHLIDLVPRTVTMVTVQLILPPMDTKAAMSVKSTATVGDVLALAREQFCNPEQCLVIKDYATSELLNNSVEIGVLNEPVALAVVDGLLFSIRNFPTASCSVSVTDRVRDLRAKLEVPGKFGIAGEFGLVFAEDDELFEIGNQYGFVLRAIQVTAVVELEVVDFDGVRHLLRVDGQMTIQKVKEMLGIKTGRSPVSFDFFQNDERVPGTLKAVDVRERLRCGLGVPAEMAGRERPPDYVAKLAELIETSGGDRRECAKCFSFHDYDFHGTLRDLTG
jgi:hypothetical protein